MRKKILNKIIICLLFSLLIVSVALPVSVDARTLSITSDEMDVTLLSDASMQVTETITIEFDGHWNGVYRTLPGRDGSVIKNVTVSESGNDYTYNPGSDYGPAGTYLTKTQGEGLLVDWSIDATDEVRTFVLYYEITNVVEVHNDTAELYWKFIGDENEQSTDDVTVTLTLPSDAANYIQGEDIKIWGHGPIYGEVYFDGDDKIVWQSSPLPANTYLEGRIVMPTSLFYLAPSSAYTNKDALDEILDEEQNLADKTNTARNLEKFQVFGALLLVLVTLGVIFALWIKYGKPHKAAFDGEYYRELPKTYSPAEMNYLMNKTKVTTPAFMATILDLARRKYLKIEEETQIEDRLIFDREITTYRITRTETPLDENLQSHEEKLLNTLFEDISFDGKSLTLDDIEHYAKRHKSFYDIWNSWVALVQSQTRKLNFFEKPGKATRYTTIIGFFMFVIGFFLFSKMPIMAIPVVICGVLFMVVPNTFKRRSKEAEEDYTKWKAFKRFLLHFSQMDKYEIPSLVIWEHYLVYAAALGIAKEVLKQLKIVYPNLTQDNYHFGYGWLYYSNLHRTDMMFHSFDSFSGSIEHSIRTAASKTSSGAGRGGGFSVGGGGGGGGGGFGGR